MTFFAVKNGLAKCKFHCRMEYTYSLSLCRAQFVIWPIFNQLLIVCTFPIAEKCSKLLQSIL